MKQIRIDKLIRWINQSGKVEEGWRNRLTPESSQIINTELTFPELRDMLVELDLKTSIVTFDRHAKLMTDALKDPGIRGGIPSSMASVAQCIADEMSSVPLLAVDAKRSDLWVSPLNGWENVLGAIQHDDLEDQISEASRCFALGRNAACVFHLNCVVEIGFLHIKSKVSALGINVQNKPTWNIWIKAISSYTAQSPSPPNAQKLADINSVLAVIKTPWRDLPTHAVHMVRIDEEARIQYDGIKRIMNLIAEL